MTLTHGFELLEEQDIAELNSKAQLYRHVKTGAELLSLQNDDENKVFNVTFRTPPADSTGLPHIMEHCVLGGSRKYPVKEPFVELLKGSVKTFVNAMTFPDQTSYPVASTNLKDFYNLVDVYLDAVFHPLITPHHLAQEGWHYELETIDAPLVYKGVVFNEMKGAYSSPENVLYRASRENLFPDTPYAFDSGGDPQVMPNLTYAQFKQFHDTYYHPSNARLFFYGDDDPQERLRLLDSWLNEFDPIEVPSDLPLQPAWERPYRATIPYSVDKETDYSQKGYVQLNWLLPEATDFELRMALSVLSYALVSTPASPLRKALIDSGLGEQITGGGLSTQLRQMTFSIGLKGIRLEDAEQIETLILQTLTALADEGIDPDMVEAAVNTIEFSLRENNTGSYPRGLVLLIRALTAWLYGRNPIAPLAFAAPLNAVKERLAQDATYLQALIQQYLLQNNHRATIILEPDPDVQQRRDQEEKERLAAIRAEMDEAALQTAVDYTHELRRRQETADSPADLAKIPRLTLADLDKENKRIPSSVSSSGDSEILHHDLFTNGIVYLDLGFNLRVLPAHLLPYINLFGRSLLEIGTEKEDFVKLSQRIGRKTGGISYSTLTSALQGSDESVAYLFLHGKATMSQAQDMLDILRDMLLTVKLDNPDRLRQMVLQAKSGKEAGLVPSGHAVVNGRLRAHFNQSDWASEQMSGLNYLFTLRQLASEIEQDWPGVLAKLEEIRRLLVNGHGMVANVTLDGDNWTQFAPQLHSFIADLPATPWQPAIWQPSLNGDNEGLTIPAQVNYVGKGANLYELGYKLDGSIAVVSNILRLTHLWEKVRVQGGAYGAFCSFDKRSGVLTFLSYRDPNLLETLAHYDSSADFLRQLELPQEELEKGIIGAISSLDAYQLPDAKGYTSLIWHLLGESDESRQQYREQVLSTTPADFKAFAEVLAQVKEQGQVVVMGAAEAVTAVNDSSWLKITKVL
ncbi:MAG: insulinase family protein [Ardenticatenaceae bacterium]|nr:insulinase family protein [Ardenticatenaceae bacterium]